MEKPEQYFLEWNQIISRFIWAEKKTQDTKPYNFQRREADWPFPVW